MRRAAFILALVTIASATHADEIARGEYLVRNVAVCGGCHAADEKNPDGPLSGGHEFRDWRIGIARASNLTPDDETGLGMWSDDDIVRAIRTGVRKDGRLLAPVMPYEWFSAMSDADAIAIARYLKSVPSVRNAVRQNPNLVFKFAKAVMLRPARVRVDDNGYLAQHVGLCAECHTPRTRVQAAPDRSRLFAGNAHPPKDFPANPSNLTPDVQTGIGRWSEREFINTIRTGVDPAGAKLNPFMPWHQNGRMTDDDLRAIYAFLMTLKPMRNEVLRKQ